MECFIYVVIVSISLVIAMVIKDAIKGPSGMGVSALIKDSIKERGVLKEDKNHV